MVAAGLFTAILAAFFSAVAGSAAPAPAIERHCTKMDCADQLTIRLRSSDGQPPRDVEIEIDIDGKTVTCKPNPSAGQTNPFQCEQNVIVTHQEIQRCRGADCRGTGSFEQSIEIPSTPRRVRVRVKHGERVLGAKTFVSQYARVHPNGPGCAPVCRQAKRTWRYR